MSRQTNTQTDRDAQRERHTDRDHRGRSMTTISTIFITRSSNFTTHIYNNSAYVALNAKPKCSLSKNTSTRVDMCNLCLDQGCNDKKRKYLLGSGGEYPARMVLVLTL